MMFIYIKPLQTQTSLNVVTGRMFMHGPRRGSCESGLSLKNQSWLSLRLYRSLWSYFFCLGVGMATISGVPSPFAQRNHISSNRLRKQLRKDSDTVFIQKLTETMVQHIKLRIILMCTLLIPVLARLLSRISYYIIYSIQYNFFFGGGLTIFSK